MEDPNWLTEIVIPDFFGKEFRWENLGQVNILIGPNNSGKTTVLEEICYHSIPNTVKAEVMYQDREINSGKIKIDWLISLVAEKDIFLIDLIEMGLDLNNQKTIVSKLLDANPNVQLFITTHSPFVLSSLSHQDIEETLADGTALTVKGVNFTIMDLSAGSWNFREFYPFASKPTRILRYMNVLERPEIVRLKLERLDKYVANLNQDKSLFQKADDLLAELKGIIDPFDEDLFRYENTIKAKKKLF